MQHISGAGHAGHKRVVAAGAVPADRRRALLGEPVGLAMGGVDVDGERPGAGARPGRPGSGERFAGDLVELTAVPQVNERKNVPSVEDAATRWPSTCPVAPARSQSASPIHVPPASAECTSVMAFSPTLAAPGASPRSTPSSNSSRSSSPSASVAARIRPASATKCSSSKLTAMVSGLRQDPPDRRLSDRLQWSLQQPILPGQQA